ncbi:MAG: nucleoid-associated protein [Saprospiraceae bacterium]|nr:nucleoid-associated protein [Saprospiraceae bacterium]
MINRREAVLNHVSIHYIGNELQNETSVFSSMPLDISEEILYHQLLSFFTDNFKEPEFYQFQPLTDSLDENFMYSMISSLFDKKDSFHAESIEMAKWLLSFSKHHFIHSGELMVCKIQNLFLNDTMIDAVGIFKIENKENFFTLSRTGDDNLTLNGEVGINQQKLDKACLIFNMDKDNGFTILNVDHSNRNRDAKYWREDFLRIGPKKDGYHNTKQFIHLTKEFVNERLTKQFDADKTVQAQVMQRSLDYFQKEEKFDQEEYAARIFKEDKIVEAFREFKTDFENYKQIELSEEFDISNQAVQKQGRVFKSVIKLDKNFHIYVHGNKNMIKKGVDDDGRKYYVLYYDEEK